MVCPLQRQKKENILNIPSMGKSGSLNNKDYSKAWHFNVWLSGVHVHNVRDGGGERRHLVNFLKMKEEEGVRARGNTLPNN